MSSDAFLTVSSVFGCALELRQLLLLVPESQPLHFVGNYFDMGPSPFEVFDLLLELKSSGRPVRFGLGMHETFLLCAAGLLREKPHLRTSWLHPYHGTCKTIGLYGVNPWRLVKSRGREGRQDLAEALKSRGHDRFLLECLDNVESPAGYDPAGDCVHGGSLKAWNRDGGIGYQIPAQKNYFRSDFCVWLESEMSALITEGDAWQ